LFALEHKDTELLLKWKFGNLGRANSFYRHGIIAPITPALRGMDIPAEINCFVGFF
jgi:hypothetical protein